MANEILPNLQIELPDVGADPDRWGNILNDDLRLIDRAVQVGLVSKTLSSTDVVLTADEAAKSVILLTGTLTANVSVIVPTAPTRVYVFDNRTTGNFTVTVKTPAGIGVAVAQGQKTSVYSDGVNVVLDVKDYFSQIGSGSTPRSFESKLREIISVKDFGAVGDGVADDTSAIQSAFNYANSVSRKGLLSGSTLNISQPAFVYFPSGTYLTSSAITLTNFSSLGIIGSGAAIVGSGTKAHNLFTGSTIRHLIVEDLVFQNFSTVFDIATNNADQSLYNFNRLTFNVVNLCYDSKTYNLSRSTNVNFNQCRFNSNCVQAVRAFVDMLNFNQCWFQSSSLSSYIVANSIINIDGCVFVPEGSNALGRAWVEFTDSDGAGGTVLDQARSVTVKNCRIGNEGGNPCFILANHQFSNSLITTEQISFVSCYIVAFHPTLYASGDASNGIVHCLKWPHGISFTNCGFQALGATTAKLFSKSSTLTSAPPLGFGVYLDDQSKRNANIAVGESSGYTIAEDTLRKYVNPVDPITFIDTIEYGFLKTNVGPSPGQLAATFNVNTNYLVASNYHTPISFFLLLTGQGDTQNNNLAYGGSALYYVTINGIFLNGGIKSEISFSKIHGSSWGLDKTANSDVVKIVFGDQTSVATQSPTAATQQVTVVWGARSVFGQAKVIPALEVLSRFGGLPR